MGRGSPQLVALLAVLSFLACSNLASTRRSTNEATGASDSGDQASSTNPEQQEGSGPRSITGTNLMLSASTFASVRLESPHFIVPLTTGGAAKTVAAHTQISVSAPGQGTAKIILQDSSGIDKSLTPYIRYAMPPSLVAANRIALTVTDTKSSKSVTKEIENPPSSDGRVHRVFLTRLYMSDLVNLTGSGNSPNLSDGVQAADNICGSAAADGGLFNATFLAVIAVPGFDPRSRFTFDGPVKEVGQTEMVAMGSAHFFSGSQPQWVSLSKDSRGNSWPSDFRFWSGADSDFVPKSSLDSSCTDWSSNASTLLSSTTNISINPAMGPQPMTYSWYAIGMPCDQTARILCLEQ